MVKRLKCWKKIDKDFYRNKNKNEDVEIVKVRGGGTRREKGYLIQASPIDDIEDPSGFRFLNKKPLKTRPQAVKKANSYMRKHDRC